MRLAFDIETNGLMPEVDTIQCINIIDLDTSAEYRFTDHEFYRDPYSGVVLSTPTLRNGDIAAGVKMLEDADMAVAHNGIGYDFPVLEHVRGADFSRVLKRCSQVTAALIWPNIKETDFAAKKRGKLPEKFFKKRLAGTHKLAAWGFRLGEPKDEFDPKDYGHTWATMPFCKVEDDYCMQDVRTLVALWKLIESKEYSEEAIQLEHDVKAIIYRQEQYGWLFDVKGAEQLTAQLQVRKQELNEECAALYPPFFVRDGSKTFTPKRDNKKMGYVAGAECTKIKCLDFNPGSRHHIANRLQMVDGWVPTEFTSKGQIKVDEAILETLPYPAAKKLSEFLMVEKRLGQVAEGKEGWLKQVRSDGRIHGRVNTNGAVTGRMTHFNPNVAQTPRNGTPYGEECRSLWIVPDDKDLVGCDADGLELRMMGHYLAPFDGGAFIRTILEGKKEDGTDMHSRNQAALKFVSRDNGKTFFYAMIYGAGDYKLGTIVLDDFDEAKKDKFYAKFPGRKLKPAIVRLGRSRRAALIDGITGMKQLIEKLSNAAKRGWIKGLDGRRINVRSLHSVLNTLFQGAGAVVMKKALVLCDQTVASEGLVPGEDYEFVGNIHDEFQIESDKEHSHAIGNHAASAIAEAGRHFGLRCPLAGNYDVGRNWSETH